MKKNHKNNKMIKVISPYDGGQYNIELKGSEKSIKELLSIVLHIPLNSIKGIKDNYNNYYTISSALNAKNIKKGQNQFFSVITNNDIINNNEVITTNINDYYNKNLDYINSNPYNNIYFKSNQYINNSDIYYNNIKINNIQNYGYNNNYNRTIGHFSNYFKHYDKEAYYNLITFLFKNNYIGKHNYYKLKKCIEVNNTDVKEILKPFIEFDNNYSKLINNLFPILNLDLSINKNQNSLMNKNIKEQNSILLNSLKDNFTKENLKKLNYLLLIENISIIKIFEVYYQSRDKNNLIDGLYSLLKRVSKFDLNKSNNIMGNLLKNRKSKSQNYKIIKKNTNDNSSENKKKKYNEEYLQNITEKIIKYGKKFSEDVLYLIKYELSTIPIENKADLFDNKFGIESKNLSEKNKKNIKKYYNKYIKKNIYKFLNEEEKEIYENIIQNPNSQEYNDIIKMYSDLIKDDKMKNKMELLRNKIINYLKEIKQLMEEKSKTSQNEKENESETNKEKSGSEKLIFNDEEEEEEEDEESKKEEEKESSSDSSTVVKEENETENYDNVDEESGVSIKKGQRIKKN